ncbi:DNA polymerase III subunit delta [Brumimicrobium salinarum]|uniref:DNA polymerase III subunit delta n=1 Tax=Brumimicrobium salinarum TaxID=2058658 RepID=UPI0013FD13E6|nr:DNA polymerase III subunit delta [Brumimicrobium salinarum]
MNEIIKQFKKKSPKPLYLLHGTESFYIDEIVEAATKYILEENEKDFNLTVLYGKDVDMGQLQEQVKQFPMMAERQLVIVKEAQDVRNWGVMESYFDNPSPTTVLILAHKHKKADSRKKFFKSIKKNGEIYESKKLYENQVDGWIINYLKEKGYTINSKATMLLVEFLGADLGKIAKELEKLMLVLEKGTQISEVHIEENIGISKDYNAFELNNALASRDVLKANKIINYFEQNPKAAHITQLIPLLFGFHERLMKAHFSNAKDVNGLMSALRMSFPAAKEVMQAKRIYSPKKIAKNIAILQEYDLKSKGIDRGPGSDADLLRELIYQLMH